MIYTTKFEFENAKPTYNKDRDFKLEHFDLGLRLSDIKTEKKVSAKNVLHLNSYVHNPKLIEIDAVDLTILKVTLFGKEQEYFYDEKVIFINLSQEDSSSITYQTKIKLQIEYEIKDPKKGLYFVSPNIDDRELGYQVWSQGESQEISYWIPIFDAPNQICSASISITVNKPFLGFSNGILESTIQNEDETTTYNWKQTNPHPVYLNAVFVSECDVEIQKNDYGFDFEIGNIFGKNHMDAKNSNTINLLPEMVNFLTNLYKVKFPHQKYYQVWADDFIWGGMENTSLTINSSRLLADEKYMSEVGYIEKLALHELAHQWFGDYIVINHWEELWIKEGGAVFAEIAWHSYKYGKDEGDFYRYETLQDYLSDPTKRPTMMNYYQNHEDLYDLHSYDKAGLVYAVIKKYLGSDIVFSNFLNRFLEDNQRKNVGYQDLIKAGILSTGKNLKPIIDQYLIRAGHPNFSFSSSWDEALKTFKVSIKQNQYIEEEKLATAFNLPKLDLEMFYLEDLDKDKNSCDEYIARKIKSQTHEFISIDQKEQNYYFQLEKKPDFITIDADQYYIFEQELNFSNKELKNIISYHPSKIARINALNKFSKSISIANLEFLEIQFKNTKEWFLKNEIISTIIKFNLEQSLDVIIKLVELEENLHKKVLCHILSEISVFKNIKAYNFVLKHCKSYSDSYLCQRAAYKSLGIIAGKLDDDKLIKDTFAVLLNKFNEIDYKTETPVSGGVVEGIGYLKENQDAFDFIIDQIKRGNRVFKNRIFAMSVVSNFANGDNLKWTAKTISTLDEVSDEVNFDIQRYLAHFAPKIQSFKIIEILNKVIDSTTHYRIKKMSINGKKRVINLLDSKKTNIKLLKDIDKKNLEITELKSEIEQIKNQNIGILKAISKLETSANKKAEN